MTGRVTTNDEKIWNQLVEGAHTDAFLAGFVRKREIICFQVPNLKVTVICRRNQHIIALAWMHRESDVVDVFDVGLFKFDDWLGRLLHIPNGDQFFRARQQIALLGQIPVQSKTLRRKTGQLRFKSGISFELFLADFRNLVKIDLASVGHAGHHARFLRHRAGFYDLVFVRELDYGLNFRKFVLFVF